MTSSDEGVRSVSATRLAETELYWTTVCQFVRLYEAAGSAEARLALFIVRDRPSFSLRLFFCFIAMLMIWVVLVCCASIFVRWRKGSLWFVRSLHKNDGAYLTPHVGSMFALTSVFSAVGIGLLIIYEINFWDGQVLPNPLFTQTLVWYPVWLGSFWKYNSMVWGAVITAMSILKEPEVRQGGILGVCGVGQMGMSGRVWNGLVVGVPVGMTVGLVGTDGYANGCANSLQGNVRRIFELMEAAVPVPTLVSVSQACRATTKAFPSALDADAFPIINPLDLNLLARQSLTLNRAMRLSFICWTLAGLLNFAVWLPCFFVQLNICHFQVDNGLSSTNKPNQSSSSFSTNNRSHSITPNIISLPLQVAPGPPINVGRLHQLAGPPHLVSHVRRPSQPNNNMNNSYRALIFSSVSYTVVTLSSLCLTMWGSMAPDVVLKGGHMRIRFISSLLVLFAFYGLSINLGILYQAWSTVHPRTTSSHNISTPPRLPPSINAFFSCNNKLLRLLPSRNPPNITSGKSPPHKT